MSLMNLPSPADEQFTSARLSRRITRIEDRLDVLMYLIEGDDRAVLIDTGFGVGDLGSFVRALTDKPLTVLLTHAHLDHAFGAGWFSDVRMNPLDLPVAEAHRPLAAEVAAGAKQEGRVVAPAPDVAAFGSIVPGDVLDLGGVSVRVLDASGHTPGSSAFLIPEERVLITGDAANQFTFMFHEEAATIEEYRLSLERLARETEGRYDSVLISHGSGDARPTLLDDLMALCSTIRDGRDDAVPFEFMGTAGLIARRASGPAFHDDDANIVYNPERIRQRSEASR
jgi:hydroxyacylglutathione hydrolase